MSLTPPFLGLRKRGAWVFPSTCTFRDRVARAPGPTPLPKRVPFSCTDGGLQGVPATTGEVRLEPACVFCPYTNRHLQRFHLLWSGAVFTPFSVRELFPPSSHPPLYSPLPFTGRARGNGDYLPHGNPWEGARSVVTTHPPSKRVPSSSEGGGRDSEDGPGGETQGAPWPLSHGAIRRGRALFRPRSFRAPGRGSCRRLAVALLSIGEPLLTLCDARIIFSAIGRTP